MSYRLIAVDLDDTLLNSNSQISARNRGAIRRAVALDVKFVIATGRMFRSSVHYLDDLGLDGDLPLINYHGALMRMSRSGEILLHRPVKNEIAVKIAGLAESEGLYVNVFIDDNLYIREINEYSRFYKSLAQIDLTAVGDLSRFLEKNGASPTKMSIINWDGSIDQIETRLKLDFSSDLSVLQSRPNFLEITDRLATKGQTLRWFAEREGISRESIIAFGDSHNDLDMIEYAGLGIAVENGRSAVKAVADRVTVSNDDDGVALAIEEYILRVSESEKMEGGL